MNKIYSLKFHVTLYLSIFMLLISAAILAPYLSYQKLSSEKKVNTMTDDKYYKEIDTLIDNAIASIPLPGLSVSVTNQEENLYAMQYGKNIDSDSSFALGSTSKAITATAILMLLEECRININALIRDYLSWVNPDCSITILDLLNHTSGISTYEKIDNLKYSGNYGTYEYSNANYNLLAEIIETVTGDTFSHYIDKCIFSRIGMDNSFILSNDTSQNIVQGHKSFFGLLLPYKPIIPDKATWIQAPSGYICTSPTDMTAYLRFLLDYSHDHQQLLHLVKNTGVYVNNSPAVEGIYDDNGIYGLGWIYKNVNGIDILYHTGKLSTYNSLSVLIPQKNIGISIMCSMGDFFVGTNLIEKLYEGIISILIDNGNVPSIQKNEYAKQHIAINMVLFVLIMICTLPAVLYSIQTSPFHPTILNVCTLALIHIAAPVFLIRVFPILGIPYEVVTDFAPDIFAILIGCSLMLFISGMWKLASLIILR